MTSFCVECGAKGAKRFCAVCGASQDSVADSSPAPSAPPATLASLSLHVDHDLDDSESESEDFESAMAADRSSQPKPSVKGGNLQPVADAGSTFLTIPGQYIGRDVLTTHGCSEINRVEALEMGMCGTVDRYKLPTNLIPFTSLHVTVDAENRTVTNTSFRGFCPCCCKRTRRWNFDQVGSVHVIQRDITDENEQVECTTRDRYEVVLRHREKNEPFLRTLFRGTHRNVVRFHKLIFPNTPIPGFTLPNSF